jgi:L,D-peptidoglycan transpeptidase YkuD (ErfK/YbiS/YcfS/YnhG family)
MRLLLAVLTTAAGSGPPAVPASGAQQLVTVAASSYRTTYASVTLWRRTADGCWTKTAGPWRGRVGRNGLADRRREGDGTTPTGVFGFGPVVYGLDPDPGVRYRYHRLVCGDWWDGDSASPTYNTFRHVRCGTTPSFGGGSEALWTVSPAYGHFAFIEYNVRPTEPGRGSAIFLHQDTGSATNGCVSLPTARLVRLLRWLRPQGAPVIAIGTKSQFRR